MHVLLTSCASLSLITWLQRYYFDYCVHMCDYAQAHTLFLLLTSEPEVIKGNNVIVHENDGEAVVQITRYGSNRSSILIQVATVNETAKGMVCNI